MDGKRGDTQCMKGTFFFLFFLPPCLPPCPPLLQHACVHDEPKSLRPYPPASGMSGHTKGTVSLLPNQQPHSAHHPRALPALYPG